jgi:alkaline phosphatase D
MKRLSLRAQLTRPILLGIGIAALAAVFARSAEAAVTFLGVAAGDASSTKVTLWTRAVDIAAPTNTELMLEITTDEGFASGVRQLPGACIADSTKDHVCKLEVGGLKPNTVYYDRFVGPASELSNVGRVKTAPRPHVAPPAFRIQRR